jgi:CO dehydrogenase/acetyl-CoA synthase beta subunit
MKKLKIKNWTNCIQDLIFGNYTLRRPRHSKIEVVAPKEEEEEEEEEEEQQQQQQQRRRRRRRRQQQQLSDWPQAKEGPLSST